MCMAKQKKRQFGPESPAPQPYDFIEGPELETTAYNPADVEEEPRTVCVGFDPSDEVVAQVIEAAQSMDLPVDVLVPEVNTAEHHAITEELYAELQRKMDVAAKLLSRQNLQSSDWRKKVRERLQEARSAMRFLDV